MKEKNTPQTSLERSQSTKDMMRLKETRRRERMMIMKMMTEKMVRRSNKTMNDLNNF